MGCRLWAGGYLLGVNFYYYCYYTTITTTTTTTTTSTSTTTTTTSTITITPLPVECCLLALGVRKKVNGAARESQRGSKKRICYCIAVEQGDYCRVRYDTDYRLQSTSLQSSSSVSVSDSLRISVKLSTC